MEYTELQKAVFARDQALADKEAANCEKCKGIKEISECPNSTPGYLTVIRHYPDGMPYPALRECGHSARIRSIYRLRSRLAASGLGQHFWNRTLDNFTVNDDNRKAFEIVKAWADKKDAHRWLVLTGDVGVGKTHLAAGAMQEKMKQGLHCIYSLAEDVILGYHASYQQGTTDAYVEELKTVDLLVVDDLGKESSDEKARKFIISIFDSRYESDKPTIITTNLPYQGLLSAYGKAFISRLAEVAEFIAMKGEDYRLKGGR